MSSDDGLRIRVLMLVDTIGPRTGGAERLATGLAAALPHDRFEVTLCVTRRSEADAAESLASRGVEVIDLKRSGRFDLLSFRPLVRFIRSRRPHVLHAHMFGSNVWGVTFGRTLRVPVVVAHEQTWSYRGKPFRRIADGLIGRLASAFVSVSRADRERMIRLERVPADKVHVIPNAYIPRDVEVGDLRRELGIPVDAPVVGTVAVLRPQKNLGLLITAFSLLSASHPDARLVVAGDGPTRPELESQVRERGLESRVHFLGAREDVPTILAGIDVAAMSSDYEGTPLFAVECMAHRTPLVATDVGGLPDLVEDGKSGVLVPPGDSGALTRALDSMLSDPKRRAEIAEEAHRRSRELTIERTAARFAALYERLLRGARRPTSG
jgi:glycosyltransferase involved in cell wall biosynthesis